MQERIFTFLGQKGSNRAQFYEKFKIWNKVANASQGSYLKALDAKLWLKSCMKGFSCFWAQRGRIQPDLAKKIHVSGPKGPNLAHFCEKFEIDTKVAQTSQV